MGYPEELRAARELIAKPDGWVQHVYNRSSTGEAYVSKEMATCWCSEGVLIQALGKDVNSEDYGKRFHVLSGFLIRAIGWGNIPDWNDAPGRTQAEVVAAFDRAIELAELVP